MLRNMANSLIEHKRIVTTTPKAKALRKFIEPLVTKAVRDFKAQGGEAKKDPHARRVVFSYLQDKDAVTELFDSIAQTIGDRPGGYTRILKIGFRAGDNADMSFIEFVDFSEFDTGKTSSDSGSSRRRRRRRRGKKGSGQQQNTTSTQEQEEAVQTSDAAAAAAEQEAKPAIEDAEVVEEPNEEASTAPEVSTDEERTEDAGSNVGEDQDGDEEKK